VKVAAKPDKALIKPVVVSDQIKLSVLDKEAQKNQSK